MSRKESCSSSDCRKRLRYAEYISKIADLFVTATDHKATAQTVCHLIGEGAQVSRSYIFENFDNDSRTRNTVEWVAPGIPPAIDTLQDISYEDMPYWRICLARGESIVEEDIDVLPEAIAATLHSQDIRSVLVVPLLQLDRWHGFVGFDHCTHQRTWDEADIWFLSMASKVLSASLSRRVMEEQIVQTSRLSAIGTLAAGVAHEFNNLNAGIMGLIELVSEESQLPKQSAADLEKVLRLVERGKTLTHRLLDISQQNKELTPLNPQDILEDLLAILSRKFEKQHITLDLRLTDEPVRVAVDRAELAQLFLQILVNAMEALESEDDRRLNIVVHPTSTKVRFTFQDTGSGIPAESIDALFHPFVTLRGKLGGGLRENVGLGLTIASRIAHQYGGNIEIRNRPTRGVEVRIELPLAGEPDDPNADFLLPLGRIAFSTRDDSLVDSLGPQLHRDGHHVEFFSDAAGLEEGLLNRRFDLLCLDSRTLDISSHEAVLTKLPRNRRPPVLCVTAQDAQPTQAPCPINAMGYCSAEELDSHTIGSHLRHILEME